MAQQRTTQTRPTSKPTARQTAASSRTQRRPAAGVRPFQMPFEKQNITIILAGIAIIILGYYLMSISETMGSLALDIAPIILVIGYLIVIPYGIMYGAKRLTKKETTPLDSADTKTAS